jgi:hypothetical protein
MAAEEQVEAHSTLGRLIVYATVISGFVAAYLMYRRGESMMVIARKTVTNPVGSLVSEVKNVVERPSPTVWRSSKCEIYKEFSPSFVRILGSQLRYLRA